MQKHTKLYLKAFGYTDTCFVPSEMSHQKAVDIHHIVSRGKGGEDRIENLMALTRKEHEKYGDKVMYMKDLLYIHEHKLRTKKIDYDKDWFKKVRARYDNAIEV